MTLRNNILAILETHFTGYKDEVIESATDMILGQIQRQPPEAFVINGIKFVPQVTDTPQTEETCERCVYVRGSQWCQGCNGTPKKWDGEKIVDTPQTDCG